MGSLSKPLEVLSENDVNIRAMCMADTSEFGILRLVVDNPDKGKEVLEEKNFLVKITDIIGVEMYDGPGGLTSVLKIIKDNVFSWGVILFPMLCFILFYVYVNINSFVMAFQKNTISGETHWVGFSNFSKFIKEMTQGERFLGIAILNSFKILQNIFTFLQKCGKL